MTDYLVAALVLIAGAIGGAFMWLRQLHTRKTDIDLHRDLRQDVSDMRKDFGEFKVEMAKTTVTQDEVGKLERRLIAVIKQGEAHLGQRFEDSHSVLAREISELKEEIRNGHTKK